eukprot:m.211948 g.211948  ORF g.211948 m.211948 type:complete len:177 (+) comp18582_c2_seq2:1194-1724(+)
MIVLFSVCNTFGRLLAGFLADRFRHRVPKPAWLMLGCIGMGCAQLFFAFAPVDSLFAAVVLLGVSYGSFFCLMPLLYSEFFGVSNFGANFGLAGLAPAAGSEVFSTALAGHLADSHARHSYILVANKDGGDSVKHCLGPDCFRTTLLITTSACALGLIIAIWLTLRHRIKKTGTMA